ERFMRIASLLIASVVAGSSVWAHDEKDTNGNWPDYFRLGFGGVFTPDADGVPGGTIGFDPGYNISMALGWETALSQRVGFDIEAEVLYQYWTVDEDDMP